MYYDDAKIQLLYEKVVSKQQLLNKINALKVVDRDDQYDLTFVDPPRNDLAYDEVPKKVDIFARHGADQLGKTKTTSEDLDDLVVYQDVLIKESLVRVAGYDNLDPVVVVQYEDKKYLIDGNHRFAIAYLRGDTTIDCQVFPLED